MSTWLLPNVIRTRGRQAPHLTVASFELPPFLKLQMSRPRPPGAPHVGSGAVWTRPLESSAASPASCESRCPHLPRAGHGRFCKAPGSCYQQSFALPAPRLSSSPFIHSEIQGVEFRLFTSTETRAFSPSPPRSHHPSCVLVYKFAFHLERCQPVRHSSS